MLLVVFVVRRSRWVVFARYLKPWSSASVLHPTAFWWTADQHTWPWCMPPSPAWNTDRDRKLHRQNIEILDIFSNRCELNSITMYTWSLLVVVFVLWAPPCEPHKFDLWCRFQAHTLTGENRHTQGYWHTAKDKIDIILFAMFLAENHNCAVEKYGYFDYHDSVLDAAPLKEWDMTNDQWDLKNMTTFIIICWTSSLYTYNYITNSSW